MIFNVLLLLLFIFVICSFLYVIFIALYYSLKARAYFITFIALIILCIYLSELSSLFFIINFAQSEYYIKPFTIFEEYYEYFIS